MNQKIVFISPPTQTNRTPEENLGLEYLAAESRISGHQVTIIDAWMERKSLNNIVNKVLSISPTVIGFGPSMDSFKNTYAICDRLRQKGYIGKIILGGIYASFEAERIVYEISSVDGVLSGESDFSFQQYLNSLCLKGIPGAVYISNNKILKENSLHGINNLDVLPLPARDNFSLVKSWKTPSHVMGSRGCYGDCSFCSVACFQKYSSNKRWRGRSPESIVSELINLVKIGENMIKFIDDNFFGYGNKEREKKIAKLIIKSGIKIRFRISLRVNDVDDEVISLLKKAGLFAVSLGVESFVQRKLNDFSKGTTVKQNLEAIKILQKYGIFVQMGFIMFDPFIILDEIKQELDGLIATRWAITKGISTKLFAADGTRITQKIKEKVGFIDKEGVNNIYQIRDIKARLFAQVLSYWAKKQNALYEMTIDPISAPKNIPYFQMKKLHFYCQQLKDLDIQLAFFLYNKIKHDEELKNLTKFVDDFYQKNLPFINKIQIKVSKIYNDLGLEFLAIKNKRI